MKHTYFVTHKKLNLIQQNKLTKYNIDTVIQLNGTDTYPEFYAFLTEVYYKAIKEKAQDSLNNLSPIVISVPSSQNTIEQDFKFLVNSNECFKSLVPIMRY